MNQQPQIQKPKKKLSKKFIIITILIIIAVLGWAGLTKAGFISNYLNIEFLCAEQDISQPSYVPTYTPTNSGENMDDKDDKPVIYLYPQQKQQVNVKLSYSGNLTVSYPEYKNG